LLCPNVNLDSFKNELNTYLVEVLLQGNDELSMDDNIVIFQCVYEFIENSNRFLRLSHTHSLIIGNANYIFNSNLKYLQTIESIEIYCYFQ
jgi:hypothetical protein